MYVLPSSARHSAQVCCFFALVRELQTLGAVTVRSVPSIPYRTSRQEKRINKISIFFRMRKDIAFAPSVRHLFLFNFYMNRQGRRGGEGLKVEFFVGDGFGEVFVSFSIL